MFVIVIDIWSKIINTYIIRILLLLILISGHDDRDRSNRSLHRIECRLRAGGPAHRRNPPANAYRSLLRNPFKPDRCARRARCPNRACRRLEPAWFMSPDMTAIRASFSRAAPRIASMPIACRAIDLMTPAASRCYCNIGRAKRT